MTPMKKLKENFKILRANIEHLYTIRTLENTNPKWNPLTYTRSKGVESDFMMLFQRNEDRYRQDNKYPTLSFVFDYKDKEEKDIKINVQIKKGIENDTIESSEFLSFEDFRVKLNFLNKTLKEKRFDKNYNYNADTFLEEVSNIFLNKKLDFKKELEINTKEVENNIKPLKEKYKKSEEELNSIKESILNIEKNINKRVNLMKETQLIKKLEIEIQNLKKSQKERKEKLEEEFGLSELKSNFKKLDKEKKLNFIELEKKLENELKKYPNKIRNSIKL